MRKLIIHGNPGIRKGEEWVCFGINRNGDWHGPDRPQLWCTIGKPEEEETFERREYISNHLDVDAVDAESIEVIQAKA